MISFYSAHSQHIQYHNMKTSILLQLFLTILSVLSSQGTKTSNDVINAPGIVPNSETTHTNASNEASLTQNKIDLDRSLQSSDNKQRSKNLRGTSNKLSSPQKSLKDSTDSATPHRNLSNAEEIWRKPITQWDLEDWILFFILFYVFLFVINCLGRIHCCGCSVLDCLGCYFCYQICLEPSGLDYGLC